MELSSQTGMYLGWWLISKNINTVTAGTLIFLYIFHIINDYETVISKTFSSYMHWTIFLPFLQNTEKVYLTVTEVKLHIYPTTSRKWGLLTFIFIKNWKVINVHE